MKSIMTIDTPDDEIMKKAERYIGKNKKIIAKEQTDKELFPPEKDPVSIFMAGSSGAGKTESSKNLLLELGNENIIRIDPDELRENFEDYNGGNSHLFQSSVTILAEKIHDLALKNKQSFVFDSTFHNYNKSISNIKRSLNKQREVLIIFVYQNPVQAWQFVQKREEKEGRRISKDVFITKFYQARETADMVKADFGSKITLDLVIKNIDGSNKFYRNNIDSIDNYLKEKYTTSELNQLL